MEGAEEEKEESVTWQETRYSTRGDLFWILELRDRHPAARLTAGPDGKLDCCVLCCYWPC